MKRSKSKIIKKRSTRKWSKEVRWFNCANRENSKKKEHKRKRGQEGFFLFFFLYLVRNTKVCIVSELEWGKDITNWYSSTHWKLWSTMRNRRKYSLLGKNNCNDLAAKIWWITRKEFHNGCIIRLEGIGFHLDWMLSAWVVLLVLNWNNKIGWRREQ